MPGKPIPAPEKPMPAPEKPIRGPEKPMPFAFMGRIVMEGVGRIIMPPPLPIMPLWARAPGRSKCNRPQPARKASIKCRNNRSLRSVMWLQSR